MNGAARRTSAAISSTVLSPIAQWATICCASTSSGLRRYRVSSIRPSPHPIDDDRGLEEIAAVLREHLAAARLADLMTRTADALQPARHRAGRLDLDDEVDGAHVDAELEAARRDDRPERAGLELVLDDDALLARERAVVRLDEILATLLDHALLQGELVEAGRESLGRPTRVAEDDRRAVREDQLSSRGCIAGQMLRRSGPAAAGPLTGSSITSPSAPMSSTGRRPRRRAACARRRRRS